MPKGKKTKEVIDDQRLSQWVYELEDEIESVAKAFWLELPWLKARSTKEPALKILLEKCRKP